MPRLYNKKSPYWQARKAQGLAANPSMLTQPKEEAGDPKFFFTEGEHYSAVAACGGGSNSPTNNVAFRDQISPVVNPINAFPNLSGGLVPFSMVASNGMGYGNNYSLSGPIGLAMQAYWNVAVARNAINMMVDYSISKIRVKTDNLTVKKFFTSWLEAIKINAFQPQFYLEYYRSGNSFIYKFNGKIQDGDFDNLKQTFSAKTPVIPIRYIILNPLQVFLQTGANTPNSYVRALSPYEITRLNNPQTEEDKQVFNSLPKAVQQSIKQGANWLFITIPLDQKRLSYCFYRKQDYEPLAVPMIFPVLQDIEFKLMLKKLDMTLAATMEQVMLLVTTGKEADEYNPATGRKNIAALQNLFQNQTVGRVLVADHTTKGEWLIPDLKELLGNAKYARVDADIKEGLQYVFFGEEKFANAAVKAQIFIQSLKEGQRALKEDFLMPEIKLICQAMNFKTIPDIEFETVDLEDKTIMNKLYYQMGQLGLLTADEVNEALENGILPDASESVKHQQEYKKQRDNGLYQPLLGKPQDGGEGRPNGSGGTPAKRTVKTPIGKSKASIGMMKLSHNLFAMHNLRDDVETSLLKKYKIDSLNDAQKTVAQAIAKSIIIHEEDENKWKESVASYITKPKDISKEITNELTDIAVEYDVDIWNSLILRRSMTPIQDLVE